MKRRIAVCIDCNHEKEIYALKRCGTCYTAHKREEYKSKQKNKPKSKPFKKISKITRSKTGELELFIEIWNERPHKSQLSGEPIDKFNVSCFAHLLGKGKYPEMRLNKENIWLLTAEEHRMLDQGTEVERKAYEEAKNISWEPLFKEKERLRSKLEFR